MLHNTRIQMISKNPFRLISFASAHAKCKKKHIWILSIMIECVINVNCNSLSLYTKRKQKKKVIRVCVPEYKHQLSMVQWDEKYWIDVVRLLFDSVLCFPFFSLQISRHCDIFSATKICKSQIYKRKMFSFQWLCSHIYISRVPLFHFILLRELWFWFYLNVWITTDMKNNDIC